MPITGNVTLKRNATEEHHVTAHEGIEWGHIDIIFTGSSHLCCTTTDKVAFPKYYFLGPGFKILHFQAL